MIVVCASARPRSAIISTRSRRLSLNRRYHRTHTMMTSRSKWRPSNNSSMLFSLLIADLQCVQLASVAEGAGEICTRAVLRTDQGADTVKKLGRLRGVCKNGVNRQRLVNRHGRFVAEL